MRKRFLVLLLAALVVGGCAAVPTSGSPHQFTIEVPDRAPLGQLGAGPQLGTSEEQLVTDFLRASAAGAFDDYATAKLYLLPNIADRWRPTAQVTVFPTDKIPVPTLGESRSGTTDVLVEVPTMATLDSAGVLNEYSETQDTPVVFRLVKNEDGEWRIGALEDGLILSQSSFTTGFGQFDLFFPSLSEETLVADPRWVPRLRVSSHLVQGLLAGPSANLEGAVAPNLAGDLSLPTGGVEVQGRVAYVDLEGQMPMDQEVRSLLQWQMNETLRQSPDVQVALVSVNGVELDSESVPSSPAPVLDRVVAFQDQVLVSGPLHSPSKVSGAPDTGENPQLPALGPYDSSPYAWVAGEGNTELRFFDPADAEPVEGEETVHPGEWESRPSIDPLGNLWVAGADGLIYFFEGGVEEAVIVSVGASDEPVSKVSVSPDGARIALLVGEGVWVGTVVFDSEGVPTIRALSQEERLRSAVLDATWASATALVALVGEGSSRSVVLAPVGAFQNTFGAPPETVRVSGGAGGLGVLVQREDQVAFHRVGAGWREVSDELAYVAAAN